MENFLKIKKILPKLTSADLELLIRECSHLIRKKSAEEFYNSLRMARKLGEKELKELL